jgi:hypothetical protein
MTASRRGRKEMEMLRYSLRYARYALTSLSGLGFRIVLN